MERSTRSTSISIPTLKALKTLNYSGKLKCTHQNSFSVGKDGVYIVSNYALYKLRFNEENKQIELDPKWVEAYKEGDLVYTNDRQVKPGQLNAGGAVENSVVAYGNSFYIGAYRGFIRVSSN